MRGKAARKAMMLTAVTPDDFVPQHHPLWRVNRLVMSLNPPEGYGGRSQTRDEGVRTRAGEDLILMK